MLFNPDRCYRPDEIADILSVSKRTVYRMISDISDPLPAFRPNGKYLRVSGLELNNYLDKHKVIPEEE